MFNTKKMKSLVIIVGVIVTTCLCILLSCERQGTELSPVLPELSQEALIKRGKYLTTVGGCNDCHSPKVMTAEGPMPDTTRLFSGHPSEEKLNIKSDKEWMLFSPGLTAFVGPWGVSYAANLSPDDTGIGNWSFEQFKTAIRKGKYKGLEAGRPLLPPMPWQQYRHMSDEDLKAVFTYLKSLRPVNNVVPAPISPEKIKV